MMIFIKNDTQGAEFLRTRSASIFSQPIAIMYLTVRTKP